MGRADNVNRISWWTRLRWRLWMRFRRRAVGAGGGNSRETTDG